MHEIWTCGIIDAFSIDLIRRKQSLCSVPPNRRPITTTNELPCSDNENAVGVMIIARPKKDRVARQTKEFATYSPISHGMSDGSHRRRYSLQL